jgi:hypothetical protein
VESLRQQIATAQQSTPIRGRNASTNPLERISKVLSGPSYFDRRLGTIGHVSTAPRRSPLATHRTVAAEAASAAGPAHRSTARLGSCGPDARLCPDLLELRQSAAELLLKRALRHAASSERNGLPAIFNGTATDYLSRSACRCTAAARQRAGLRNRPARH